MLAGKLTITTSLALLLCSTLPARAQADNPTAAPSAANAPTTRTPASSAPDQAVLDNTGHLSFVEENDYFASYDDRHYTQGVRMAYLSGRATTGGFWDQPFRLFNAITPFFGGADSNRKYALLVGQSIFTPENTQDIAQDIKDRPYAAWLYTGVSLLQETPHETHHTLENFELIGGVVGRWAGGAITQNDYHQFIGVKPALGWLNQLQNEPGAILTYERKWRFQQRLYGNLAIDIIPELGVSGGNILTYGQGGVMARFGQNLGADYGPTHIRPGLSGTDWFDATQLDGDFGWYIFAGTQGRAVARNIFLDGNSFVSSPHVNKEPLVADFMIGATLFWSDAVRLDFSAVQRTKEFYGQNGHPDRFGGLNITFRFL